MWDVRLRPHRAQADSLCSNVYPKIYVGIVPIKAHPS